MGVRFRLKASFDISGFSATNQIILRALKKYGMMLADNGSAWFLSGAPDPNWNNTDLHVLTTITGSAFEVVDVSPLMVDPNSGQALQNGISVTVTPSSASVAVNAQRQFSAVVNGSSNQSVTWGVNGNVGGNSVVGFIDSVSGLTPLLERRPESRNGNCAGHQPDDTRSHEHGVGDHHRSSAATTTHQRDDFPHQRVGSHRPDQAIHGNRSEHYQPDSDMVC